MCLDGSLSGERERILFLDPRSEGRLKSAMLVLSLRRRELSGGEEMYFEKREKAAKRGWRRKARCARVPVEV